MDAATKERDGRRDSLSRSCASAAASADECATGAANEMPRKASAHGGRFCRMALLRRPAELPAAAELLLVPAAELWLLLVVRCVGSADAILLAAAGAGWWLRTPPACLLLARRGSLHVVGRRVSKDVAVVVVVVARSRDGRRSDESMARFREP